MNTNRAAAGGIAGLAFLLAALCVAVAVGISAWDTYAPAVREFLLWLAEVRFLIGMVFGMAVMLAIVLCLVESKEG